MQPWLTLEFWQQEIDNVLVQGIFGRSGSKSSAVDRIHAVWPELSAAWLRDRMEEVARAGLPQMGPKRVLGRRGRSDSSGWR